MKTALAFTPQYVVENALQESLAIIENPNTFWIAYSGGLDSHVLLHAVFSLQKKIKTRDIRVIHIHHGLSENADAWQLHCEAVCNAYDLPMKTICVDANHSTGESPENKARQARYAAFENLLDENDCVLTAHHQDDQAETLLLQLFRGAGVKGLSGMPSQKKLGKGILLRPFLSLSRDVFMDYARAAELNWINDESNLNTAFNRNFLRHEIMPILTKRFPSVHKTIARSAALLAVASDLHDDLARLDLEKIVHQGNQISISDLSALSVPRRINVLRYWLRQNGFSMPNTQRIADVMQQFFSGKIAKNACVQWGNVRLQHDGEMICCVMAR